ncbi:hypothetical protein [Faecalicoccus pleomorphus]|uniref:hypothetical protein n=1 Tax=Faecalicoccus pleomorphus TaxID=1323 RepID=UPI0039F636FF
MSIEKVRIAKKIKTQNLQYFDNKFNVDFSKSLTRDYLGYDKESHCFGYQPSFVMPNIFSYLKVSRSDSILDIGCGKGFAIHLFSSLPFGRIDGIESKSELVYIAKDNLTKLHPEDDRIHIFKIDAVDFVNYENYDFLYLFNPFDEVIVDIICQKLENHQSCKIIYQIPLYVDVFLRHGFEIEYEADGTIVLRR